MFRIPRTLRIFDFLDSHSWIQKNIFSQLPQLLRLILKTHKIVTDFATALKEKTLTVNISDS